ncbi:unnamed protein product [Psylliodes chrysocephalus]|uniref:Uncharacterized protein n=1 Tax=Psylliodes chrysocephalus TaxID=3402493 RepID=A0A9P0CM21_9CUCU|nr:unnamed protein product [Psylliodes chrysocephala]
MSCEFCDTAISRTKPDISYAGFCGQKVFPTSCVEVPSEVVKHTKPYGLLWYCQECYPAVTDFSHTIDKRVAQATCQSVVVIKPKDTIQNNIQTKADIMSNINPTELNIKVSEVKNTRDGETLVGCSNNEDASKFKDAVNAKLADAHDRKKLKVEIRKLD